jgi:hypothetical protein
MITVTTEKQLRERRNPGFCYICSELWVPRSKWPPEHVVPSNAFLREDHKQVLTLLAHPACNDSKSGWDERIGQVFKMLHGTLHDDHLLDLVIFTDPNTSEQVGGFVDFDFRRILIGWLKGFHATLYREYLPHDGERFAFNSPWCSFIGDPNNEEPMQRVQRVWVETLVASRIAQTTDRITAWNGKLRYECTWSFLDDGRPVCLFALDIYDWARLSPSKDGRRRSCTGIYHPGNGIPAGAARATNLVIPGRIQEPFDAFSGLVMPTGA